MVFISYHRADSKYRKIIEDILKENKIKYYAVPENVSFDGQNHHHIKDQILSNMGKCDIILCIVGKETYARPHVDWELHCALKGNVGNRKGLIAVMLEKRLDSKSRIDYNTFPNRIEDNEDYAVLEQMGSFATKVLEALDQASDNRNNKFIQLNNTRPPMQLRTGKYYDC